MSYARIQRAALNLGSKCVSFKVMDEHELVSAVKTLALELGKTPTKSEFVASLKGGQYKIDKFGGYVTLLRAAGLDTYEDRRAKKLDNSIFERSLPEVLSAYEPRNREEKIRYGKTLFIPDTHFPFHSKRVLDAIYEFILKHQPERVIQLGDLYDLYAYSRFPKSMNVYKPQEESDLARKEAESMWKEISSLVPTAKKIQITGNHDIRPLKSVLSAAPGLEHMIEKYMVELMTFPGVELISDPREAFKFDDVQVIHGYTSGMGKHRDYFQMNTVIGHQHVGHVTYRNLNGKVIWELGCGLAGDPESKAFTYTPNKINNWQQGFGFLDEYGPRFISV